MSRSLRTLVVLLLTIFVATSIAALAQPPQRGGGPGGRGGRGDRADEPQIKPYDEVITEEAKTDEGVFKVHRIKDKVFYEIPAGELGDDFLWVSSLARTTLGVGYGGQRAGTRVVRWEREGDRIFLTNVSYSVVSDPDRPIARAVEAANNNSIIKAFDISALSPEGSAVIDVTSLFASEVTEFSARSRLQARGFDRERSFVSDVLAFPTNIEVRATQTYTRPPENNAAGGARRAPTPAGRRGPTGMRPGSATVLMHYSMIKLPEDPMMPRLFDPRVGYFTHGTTDYGRDEHKATERRFIARYRLDKKNPGAEISDPVKPIVYWIDPATPEKWRPFVAAGIEKWQAAFEAAGFSNAIIAKQGPTPDEDPEWHPEDARYSVIRWLPSTTENASGPHVSDPRTGEILEADVQFYHNVQNLLRSWYFLQVGHLDERTHKLPMPDELMGVLLEYVVAHEVGHTLGFQHNMKASSMYPFEKIRDPEWVKTMSHTPTLMDYSRFNYVAQPEDGIAVEDLIPKIGPYDKWATMWGYKPIPEAKTPDEEKTTLDKWAREQDEKPWLRFSTAGSRGSDPGELTEAVGDANAVAATKLGVKNLERISDLLMGAASTDGESWADLEELYSRLLGQWVREMNHVVAIVGGFDSQQKHAGQKGVRFTTVSRERQKEAVEFLNEYAFQTPEFMIKPEILRRIEPSGVIGRIGTSQGRVLNSLLNPARFDRLVEQETLDRKAAYKASEMLADLEHGVWRELSQGQVSIDAYRRNLQRTYLEVADTRINGSTANPSDLRAFLRGQLKRLDSQLAAASARAADDATRFHVDDLRVEIGNILDPKFERSGGSAAAAGPRRAWMIEEAVDELSCWPDLAIRP